MQVGVGDTFLAKTIRSYVYAQKCIRLWLLSDNPKADYAQMQLGMGLQPDLSRKGPDETRDGDKEFQTFVIDIPEARCCRGETALREANGPTFGPCPSVGNFYLSIRALRRGRPLPPYPSATRIHPKKRAVFTPGGTSKVNKKAEAMPIRAPLSEYEKSEFARRPEALERLKRSEVDARPHDNPQT